MTAHPIDQLSPYLDGELAPAEREAVGTHLRECPECARRLGELAAVDDLARALPVKTPAGYFESFPARLRERLPRPAPGPRRLPMWALAAAAVLLVAVITPLTLRQRSLAPSGAATPRATASEAAGAQAPKPRELEDRPPASVEEGLRAAADKRQGEGEAAAGSGRTLAKTAGESRERDVPARRDAPTAPPAAQPAQVGEAAPAAMAPVAGGGRSATPSPGGPWFQAQTQSQGPPALAPPPSARPAEESGRKEPEAVARSQSAPAKREGARVGERDALDVKSDADLGFASLQFRKAGTAKEARALATAWRRWAAENPSHPRLDEARVAAIEAAVLAFQLGHDPADRAQVEAEGRAYLARPGPSQADRVRALLASLDR